MEVTQDAALGGRLRLKQLKRGHRFGHDSILLAAAVPAKPGDRVVELGAGIGAAGLALAWRVPDIDLTLVEIEPALVALAEENIAANGFAGKVRAVKLDVAAPARRLAAAGIAAGSADHVLMNPPFNDPAHQASPDRLRRRAHAADDGTLAVWIGAAERMLRAGGRLTLIGRADGLQGILSLLNENCGGISVLPIHPSGDKPAIRAICSAIKNRHGPLRLLPGLVLNEGDGTPSAAAEALLREGAPLSLDG